MHCLKNEKQKHSYLLNERRYRQKIYRFEFQEPGRYTNNKIRKVGESFGDWQTGIKQSLSYQHDHLDIDEDEKKVNLLPLALEMDCPVHEVEWEDLYQLYLTRGGILVDFRLNKTERK